MNKNTQTEFKILYLDTSTFTDFLPENIFTYTLENIKIEDARVHTVKIIMTNPNLKFESVQYIKKSEQLVFFTNGKIRDQKYKLWVETKDSIIYECGLKNTLMSEIDNILENPCPRKSLNLYDFYHTLSHYHANQSYKISKIKAKITYELQSVLSSFIRFITPKIIKNTLFLEIELMEHTGIKHIEFEIIENDSNNLLLKRVSKNTTSMKSVEIIYSVIEAEIKELYDCMIDFTFTMNSIPKEMSLRNNLYADVSYDDDSLNVGVYSNKMYPEIRVEVSNGVFRTRNFDVPSLKILNCRELELFSAIDVPEEYTKQIKNITFKKHKFSFFKRFFKK